MPDVVDPAAGDGIPVTSAARLVRTTFRLLAAVMGAALAVGAMLRQSMNEDGISYLDMGDAYLRGDWAMAVNAVWSPLYAWILGLAMWLADPSPRWEFALVHAVNFGIYLAALAGFEFFWRRLTATVRTEMTGDRIAFPEWAWISVGYGLFIWSSLALIRIWAVTPDMLVSALVYLAAGLLLGIASGRTGRRTQVAFGVVLGLAYLAKSVMFPLAFVFLLLAVLAQENRRQAAREGLLALAAFLIVALPLVAALSSAKGRPTFGESGRLSYLRYVNDVPYPFWTAEAPPGLGEPEHPARQVFDDPPVYEFGTPVGGTYPLSYDPSYWYEGVSVRLTVAEQMKALLSSARWYFEFFVRQQAGALAVLTLLIVVGGLGRREPASSGPRIRIDSRWALTLVAIAAFALYALVYVEGRYLAPFVVLFWGGILAHVGLPDLRGSRRLLEVSGAVLVFFTLLNLAAFTMEFSRAFLGLDPATPGEPAPWPPGPVGASGLPSEIGEGLRELGIGPGDRIGFVGYAFGAYFARLGRIRIVAQIHAKDAEGFWSADPSRRRAVLAAFARAGAKAVVTDRVPTAGPPRGWVRVGETGHWARLLTGRSVTGLGDQAFQVLPPKERLGDPSMPRRVPVVIEGDVVGANHRLGVAAVAEEREEVDERRLPRLGPGVPEGDLP